MRRTQSYFFLIFHFMPLLFQHKIGHYFKGADKEAQNEKLKN